MTENEEDFTILLGELTRLVESLDDCVYIKHFFWAARSMMEEKSFSEKKKIIGYYKNLFVQIEGECWNEYFKSKEVIFSQEKD